MTTKIEDISAETMEAVIKQWITDSRSGYTDYKTMVNGAVAALLASGEVELKPKKVDDGRPYQEFNHEFWPVGATNEQKYIRCLKQTGVARVEATLQFIREKAAGGDLQAIGKLTKQALHEIKSGEVVLRKDMEELVERLQSHIPECDTWHGKEKPCDGPAIYRLQDYDGEEYTCKAHIDDSFYSGSRHKNLSSNIDNDVVADLEALARFTTQGDAK